MPRVSFNASEPSWGALGQRTYLCPPEFILSPSLCECA